MKISYSFGMADFIHFGHINALKIASVDSDLNIFGLVSDEASDAWFGSHVSNETERRAVLEGIRYVDEVWQQETFDPLDNLKAIHIKYPDAVISLYSGNEWGLISAKKYLESIGGKVVRVDYYDKLSPQAILDTLNRNEIAPKNFSGSNIISTKANTLQSLKTILTKARIEELYIVTVGDFKIDSAKIANEISNVFGQNKIVVRSSSKREDAFEESNAGHFDSVLGVEAFDTDEIKRAISFVIASYGDEVTDDEQVLIQRQTENVIVSGVIFTRDIQRNRPYYVINYDDTGKTDSVTSGTGGKSAWLSHDAHKDGVPAKWKTLMEAVWELEDFLPGVLLDIEFALTEESVVIFQVRPLAAAYKFGRNNNDKIVNAIKDKAIANYQKLTRRGLTCFSDMAFWNPAEIIGDNPKNLDFSLYREIITKSSWDEGLTPLGYRAVPKELMFRFGNKPYINVEESFEALIPAAISDRLATKLREHYVKRLKQDLSAHDKIEFEISHNCYDFSTRRRLLESMMRGFSTEEILSIERALIELTKKAIVSYDEILSKDLDDLRRLESVRLDIVSVTHDNSDFRQLAKSIRTLLKAINTFGTPQFARQARCAFIAKSICRSLVSEGYIDSGQFDSFMSTINTIAVDYERDYRRVLTSRMPRDSFFRKYGHLRAGTYNIRSLRYDQMDQLFSRNEIETSFEATHDDYDAVIKIALDEALSDVCLDGLTSAQIINFVKQSTEQREYFKFVFTKSLSFALELIKQIGQAASIGVAELSYLELPEIYAAEYYTAIDRLQEFWSLIIDERREIYKINSEIILPAVICSEDDFIYVENIDARPNFITEKIITGDVVILDDFETTEIDGKIVVIEKADPGYDWIFSKGIAGLLTKYGGAASHMAIRCAEFKVPAAIGVGANLYDYVAEAKTITIDCKHEKIIRKES